MRMTLVPLMRVSARGWDFETFQNFLFRKSVAHLPWKAFMYKAFNTFIDDVFAFIIKMPTTHRIACFRDDIVFFCYLYQVSSTKLCRVGETIELRYPVMAPRVNSKAY